jgi:hypothetical protein
MKTIATALMSAAFAAFAIPAATAAEEAAPATAATVTLEGTATCAKCDLETKDKCQSVLQVKKDGKTETYVLEGKAGGDWHKTICKKAKEAKITGTVSEKDGEKILTATKIEMTGKAKKAKDGDAEKG